MKSPVVWNVPHCHLLRRSVFVVLGLLCSSPLAPGGVVVSMTGTIDTGDLNGIDLSGQTFEFQGLVTATEDADDFDDFGLFILESASFDFAGGSRFRI
jgi:hypothetical protein